MIFDNKTLTLTIMKKNLLLIALVIITATSYGQENKFTLSGGYAFANIEEADADASGFRINGLYEFQTVGTKVAHGFSVGYIGTDASTTLLGDPVDYKISSWPIYYAPKFIFGQKSFKGFVRGALGWQFSKIEREGTAVEASANDSGFYGGAALGVMKDLSEKYLLTLSTNGLIKTIAFIEMAL
jgi:hypothetical protein